ncbi:MAG: type and secretion system protein [Bryobacterales bacterium]|nr:type and secretion system protein [Bryobacterales bacterium]
MKFSKTLTHRIALLLALASVAMPLVARTRKGDHFIKLAQKAEADKDFDKALDFYEQALATDPKDAGYLLADQRARSATANWRVGKGRQLLAQQKLNEALVEFEAALLADPGSQIAIQEVRQTTAMIKQKAQAPANQPILTPAERARQEIENRINSLEGPPTLRPINDQIRSLKMNNQPVRVLYESVGKLAGVNVLFDPQGIESVSGKNFNLDLTNVGLDEALNYIALETHTFWKPISRNAIFVTQESEPKRQEYQDQIVKVFYIQNATTPAEFTEIFNAVRTGAKLTTGIFQVASQSAIVARGPTDQMALVEKLVHDLDKAKPEVVVDVVVMEVNKSTTRTLGAALLGQGGLNTGINFTPRNPITTTSTSTSTSGTSTNTTTSTTTSAGGAIPLSRVGHISTSDFSLTLPGALLQALLSDTNARVLQRPQVRATDGGKASLKIGQKIPYVSGSLNSAVATAGSIPYATTQFQQVDVGVNIDMQPHVNGVNDVSMKIKVEISNTAGNVDIAGVQEPIITQRVNEADIRMRDGEPTILGGLSDSESSNTASGIPGVLNMPVLGYLFGSKTRTRVDDQILVALIPHIVRAPDLSATGDPGVLAGTERNIRVVRKPAPASTSPVPPVGSRGPSGSVTPGGGPAGVPQNRQQPQPVPGDGSDQQFGQQPEPADVPQQQPEIEQPQNSPQ